MKLGIIFKKEFQNLYGKKKEFSGDEITITKKGIEDIHFGTKTGEETNWQWIPVEVIQLIYLGEWNK